MNIQEGEGEMATQASFELEPIKEEEEPTEWVAKYCQVPVFININISYLQHQSEPQASSWATNAAEAVLWGKAISTYFSA